MLNASLVKDSMYVEQPNNLKPETFDRATNFLTHSDCLRIKNMHKNVEKWEGKVHDKDNSKKANSVRQVDVYPIQDLGLAELIYDTVKSYNATSFRFDIAGIFDNLQLLHYKTGHHYDWHTDIGQGIYSNRKISVSILLDDKCDGGELVLKQGADRPIYMEAGDMVMFPSYVLHKITPVTKGERWSLVTWIQDIKPFR